MNTKKILVPAILIAAIGAGAIFKVSLSQAATSPQSGFIQYLSQKLGIEESKVQTVFNDYHQQQRQQRQQQMTENYTIYLDGLVKQGKITAAQKTALLTKHAEIQKSKQSSDWFSLSPEQKRSQIDQQRTELETWAQQQGIDASYLHFGFGNGKRGMMGPGGHGGMMRGNF